MVSRVPTEENPTDPFTKALTRPKHEYHTEAIGVSKSMCIRKRKTEMGHKPMGYIHYTLTPPSNSIGGRTTQIEFGNKFTKTSWKVSFGEDIGRLISSRNRLELNGLEYHMLSNKMGVYLDMFRSLMKYVIVSNLNGTGVVTP
ncbi:hypothetical protein OSB04_020418 [Centaurea solstitialis]|uniref:Uncharacterized protein n=1 Tax=Centaurea solstitialis TaxID=347529 RepID=A0AA38SS68_9ASTR|nr:hypothetical protein OSB04_020418 [Centaurea solstitialis]